MKIKGLQVFAADTSAEEDGKWATLAEGVEFKIRRLRAKSVMDAQKRIYGPYERSLRGSNKDLPDAIETQCTIRLLSEAVIVDWRGDGMVDDKGKSVPFTVENCVAVLSDPQTGRDIRAAVLSFATDSDFYSPEDAEIDQGNSVAS